MNSTWLRGIAVVSLLLVAGWALARPAGTESDRREVLRAFESTGELRIPPEMADRLASEPDPMRLRVLLARRLVTAEVDPARLAEITRRAPDLRTEARVERLDRAREYALEVLRERPAAWDAAMLLGASTYLARSTARDPRLFRDQRGWEGPLELAWQLAPTEPETGRFLVTAYLELWPALSETKRRRARTLLTEAFTDPSTFRRLVGAWLDVAGDRREAFEAIPDEPHAWATLVDLYARQRDWPAYLEARSRWLDALTTGLEETLEEAGRRLAEGYPERARDLYLGALRQAQPSGRHAPLVRAVLRETPAGAPSQTTAAAARDWLLWALRRGAFEEAPFEPRLVDRLAGLAGPLEPHHEAHAALAARRIEEAERIERRTALAWHEDWVPYLIARSRDLLDRGAVAGAREALDQAHRSARDLPSYWLARRRVAQAAADTRARLEAEQRLTALTASSWPPMAWRFRDGRASMELSSAADAQGLELGFLEAPSEGAVIEVRLDGEIVDWAEVVTGLRLEVDRPLAAGLHHLEVRSLAGGAVRPGEVRLLRAGV